jgi:L-rhamnose mutarotase
VVSEGRNVQRVGFLLKVREDRIDEYKEHHRQVSPDMLDALSRHGWHNYSLFMRPDGLMVGYVEVSDSFQEALNGMSTEDANSRWQTLMEPFFESPVGSRPDENMVQLEEVFHLE